MADTKDPAVEAPGATDAAPPAAPTAPTSTEPPAATEPLAAAELPTTTEPPTASEPPAATETTAVKPAVEPVVESSATKEPAAAGSNNGNEPTECIEKRTPKDEPPVAIPSDGWPALAADHPLTKFIEILPGILKAADYGEVYGVPLTTEGDFHTKLILQKFLRANANDLDKAKEQLTNTLKWRRSFEPLKVKDEVFSVKKFGGLGYITKLEGVPESNKKVDVCTFNIYGVVKDNKETFGDLDTFMKWRVALMESSVHALGLATATEPIPDYGQGPDPYQGFQVHDYMNVSFLRQDPLVKAASKKAIEVFGAFYPETMSRKFFVSVPLIMSWMFTAMRIFISKETQKKFTVMTYATSLAGDLGPSVPKEYGGKGEPLDEIGQTVKTE